MSDEALRALLDDFWAIHGADRHLGGGRTTPGDTRQRKAAKERRLSADAFRHRRNSVVIIFVNDIN